MPNQAFCLVCSKCSRAVTTRNGLVRSQMETLASAVYPYELGVLDCTSWCYSVTDSEDGRFDLVCTNVGPLVKGASPNGMFQGFVCSADPSACSANLICLNTRPESEPAWFPGFVRRPMYCMGCFRPTFLGWACSKETSAHIDFLALVVTSLRERYVDPTRLALDRKSQMGPRSASRPDISTGPLTRGQEEILAMRSRNRVGSRASFAELDRERVHGIQGPHPQVLRQRIGLVASTPSLPVAPGGTVPRQQPVLTYLSDRASHSRAAQAAQQSSIEGERRESGTPHCLRCELNVAKCRCGVLQVSSFGSQNHLHRL